MAKVRAKAKRLTQVEIRQALAGREHEPKTLVEFFRRSPLVGIKLELDRQKGKGRDIKL
jgi:hypothetical protein